MELNAFNIVKKPVVTPKSVELYRKLGQYTFEIHSDANKSSVKDAIRKIWNVEVDKVRIIRLPAKNKLFNRKAFTSSAKKKAIVSLKKGYKIEIPGLFEVMVGEQKPKETEKSRSEVE